MKIKVNISPKEGHFFVERDGAKLKAGSWGGVIKKVIRYRALNHLPAGNPADEVHAQACARTPSLCYDDRSAPTVQKRAEASLKGRVLAWLSGIRKNKINLTYTDSGVMTARANICAACPHNTALPEGCTSCRKVVKAIRKDIIGDRGQDSRIHACGIMGIDLPTAANLDEQTLAIPELPDHCWRKRKP